jgi:hypothetical protein
MQYKEATEHPNEFSNERGHERAADEYQACVCVDDGTNCDDAIFASICTNNNPDYEAAGIYQQNGMCRRFCSRLEELV